MKICILGAGVGGLTIAHELSKAPNLQNHEIHVYERNDIVGGQSRSRFVGEKSGCDPLNHTKDNIRCDPLNHTEYCWHVMGHGYVHLLLILKEIPSFGGGTVFDHLKPIEQYLYGRYPPKSSKEGVYYDESGNSFLSEMSPLGFLKGICLAGGALTFYDAILLLKAWSLSFTACMERLRTYDNIPWKDFMRNLSLEAKKWIVDSPSIYMGMKTSNLSTFTMLDLFRQRSHLESSDRPGKGNSHFFAFDGSIQKVWFDPWVKHLKENGVIFHMNANVEYICIADREISKVIVTENETMNDVYADKYINSLSVESWAKILPEGLLKDKYSELALRGHQIQTQVLYFLPSPLILKAPAIIVLPDTEWCIMIRPESNLWGIDQELLSTGIGIWDRVGRSGKIAEECTREEIAEEVWRQVTNSKGLMKYLKFKDGETLADIKKLPLWNIWSSYKFNKETGKMDTWEPKFSNSVKTWNLRPDINGEYPNLLHANAYVKTEMNIFCMESAAEAGRRAARKIMEGTSENDYPKDNFHWMWRVIKSIDKWLFDWNIPHFSEIIH